MLVEITPSTNIPITLPEAKNHLRVDSDLEADDDLINRILKAACKFIEKRTGIVLLTSTWALYLDEWPVDGVIFLKKKPISAISTVEYYNSDDATEYTELDAEEFETDIISEPCRVKIDDLPSLGDKLNAVKITFTAGYSEAAKVPENIISAILILVGHLYENRQEEITGTMLSQLGKGFEYLLGTDELITA